MDEDTKAKIDEWQKQRKIDESQKATKEIERRREREEKWAIREIGLKLWIHQRRFHCHIHNCKNVSPSPSKWKAGLGIYTNDFYWDVPTELERCTICHKWACTQVPHIYHGVCAECAEKLKRTK